MKNKLDGYLNKQLWQLHGQLGNQLDEQLDWQLWRQLHWQLGIQFYRQLREKYDER